MKKLGIVAPCALIALGAWLFIAEPIAKGLSWGDMDLDGDGHTTVREWLGAIDVDVRPVEMSGKQCREIFQLKDGMPVKEICP